jgi:hypothetical protein
MILPSLNEKVMQTKGICVPEYGKKGSGKLLIDILTELGEHLHVDKLVIFSLPEAKGFYEKVGLKEEAEWTNIMVYNFNTSHKKLVFHIAIALNQEREVREKQRNRETLATVKQNGLDILYRRDATRKSNDIYI